MSPTLIALILITTALVIIAVAIASREITPRRRRRHPTAEQEAALKEWRPSPQLLAMKARWDAGEMDAASKKSLI